MHLRRRQAELLQAKGHLGCRGDGVTARRHLRRPLFGPVHPSG
ncbi:hypothetical protein LJR039_003440 [Pseudorhodoferax sp. LjRoot39]